MNTKLVCIAHRSYDGSQPPEISCKTCCSIFLAKVVTRRDQGIYFDYKNWRSDRRTKGNGVNLQGNFTIDTQLRGEDRRKRQIY